jgi:hypothetical protein
MHVRQQPETGHAWRKSAAVFVLFITGAVLLYREK